jgi:hypothetical protein
MKLFHTSQFWIKLDANGGQSDIGSACSEVLTFVYVTCYKRSNLLNALFPYCFVPDLSLGTKNWDE